MLRHDRSNCPFQLPAFHALLQCVSAMAQPLATASVSALGAAAPRHTALSPALLLAQGYCLQQFGGR